MGTAFSLIACAAILIFMLRLLMTPLPPDDPWGRDRDDWDDDDWGVGGNP
jgi:hypothetical protein